MDTLKCPMLLFNMFLVALLDVEGIQGQLSTKGTFYEVKAGIPIISHFGSNSRQCGRTISCKYIVESEGTGKYESRANVENKDKKNWTTLMLKVSGHGPGGGRTFEDLMCKATKIWDFEKLNLGAPYVLLKGAIIYDREMNSDVLHGFGTGLAANFGEFAQTCFSDPRLCSNGVTFSLWLKFMTQPVTSSPQVIFTIGGHTRNSLGPTVYAKSSKLYTNSRLPHIMWLKNIAIADFTQWFHLMFSWSRQNGTRIYTNGQLRLESKTTIPESQTTDTITQFYIGCFPSDQSVFSPNVYLDDIVIFESELSVSDAMTLAKNP